jgi:hypothetical protein
LRLTNDPRNLFMMGLKANGKENVNPKNEAEVIDIFN